MQKALFFKKLKDKSIQCTACNRYCVISEGKLGYCNSRKNIEGELFLLTYGKPTGLQIDPIEKKPLFHFLPGSKALSFGCNGCNFSCIHCQNFYISKEFSENEINLLDEASPEFVVEKTLEFKCESIAYTYTEPTVFAEYCLDIMKPARKKGIKNVWVSNGYMSKESREKILPFIDAINVDLKGDKGFYEEICGGAKIEKVKENIKWFYNKGVHVEVTNLIIPTKNDSSKQLNELTESMASVSKEIPLHFSAFFPTYKLNSLPSTPASALVNAKKIAEEKGIKFVYLGNIPSENDSYCFNCKNLLVERVGYLTRIKGLNEKAKCSKCGKENYFVVK